MCGGSSGKETGSLRCPSKNEDECREQRNSSLQSIQNVKPYKSTIYKHKLKINNFWEKRLIESVNENKSNSTKNILLIQGACVREVFAVDKSRQ